MRSGSTSTAVSIAAAVAIALAVGCAHPISVGLPGPGGSPGPSASPSPGASSSPMPCGSPDINVSEFIAMTSTATATDDPNYGVINGYTDQYIDGFPSQTANVIVVPSSTLIQFANLEPLPPQAPEILHSAAALPTAFPSPSFTFPPGEAVALGTQISSQPWSTGPVGQDLVNFNICYSQTFTLPAGPGVYAFGDLQYFGLSNMRDVIVVSGSARVRGRAQPIRRATPPPFQALSRHSAARPTRSTRLVEEYVDEVRTIRATGRPASSPSDIFSARSSPPTVPLNRMFVRLFSCSPLSACKSD